MNQNNISYSEVIEGLKCCSIQENRCKICPIGLDWGCSLKLKKRAIALLKERESMRPGLGIIHHDDGSKSYFLHCPFDGTTLVEGDNYCRKCGRAVKWE